MKYIWIRTCQECGFKLVKEVKSKKSVTDAVPLQMTPPPDKGITVEFPFSTAQSFDFAVEAAKKLESFMIFGEDKKAIYRVTVVEDAIERLEELLENLKGWRKRTVYVNGEKVQWDNVFQYNWCYSRKKSSYKPELYCFGYEIEFLRLL